VRTWKKVVANNQIIFSADAEVIQQSTAYSLDSFRSCRTQQAKRRELAGNFTDFQDEDISRIS